MAAKPGPLVLNFTNEHIADVVTNSETRSEAANALGVSVNTLQHHLKAHMGWEPEYPGGLLAPPKVQQKKMANIIAPDEAEISDEELWEQRKRKFQAVKNHHESRKLLQCFVHVDGPIGITFLGDPHVDDDGCDIPDLDRHITTIKNTKGLMAANVGDTTNNWVGRLARLYASQSTSQTEAWKLARKFLNDLSGQWLFIVGGNHDAWSGEGMGDPIAWMAHHIDALYQPSEVRLQLNFPSSETKVVVNCRHDFKGHSMWNPAHGVMKAQQMGMMDDIAACGHTHVSGHMELKDPREGKICHALQVASFKLYDRYALEKGFRDQNISPSATCVIDPYTKTRSGRVHVFWDVEEGAQYLTWKREQWKGVKNKSAGSVSTRKDDSRKGGSVSGKGRRAKTQPNTKRVGAK